MPIGFSGKRDVYIEVAQRYEKYIRVGVLRDGDKLPSVRTAAGELGVNPNTVQRAYALLEEKGLILTIPKKGVFVTCSASGNNEEKGYSRAEVVDAITKFKLQGISLEELTQLVKEVYNDD